MPNLQHRRSRLRVFVTMFFFFVAAVVVTGGAITAANYYQAKQASLDVATSAADATVRRVSEQRAAFFASVRLVVDIYSADPRVIAGGQELDALLAPILNALETSQQISGIYAGYENGEFYQVLSFSERDKDTAAALRGPPDSRFALQTIRLAPGGGRIETWRFFDRTRREIFSYVNTSPTYDPRERGWYKEARAAAHAIGRTSPYVYAATPQVGLTVDRSFDGPLGGVVAADVTLDRLSDLLVDVRETPRHRILTFEKDGQLIASPDPDQVLKRTGSGTDLTLAPANLADLDDPVVAAAARRFFAAGPYEIQDFDIDGETFLATVVPQEELLERARTHYLLYAAPRSDFEGTLAGAATRTVTPGLIFLVLSLPVIFLIARAISNAQVALALENARVQAIIDTVPSPVFYKGPDSRFVGCNRAYEECFAIGRSAIIGKRVLDLEYLPLADRVAYQAEDEELIRTAGMVRREMAIPFADGKVHPTLYYVKGFHQEDGELGGLVGTFVDISEQAAAQRAMAEAKELAEAATKAKSDFLASMSHEIRTPMNGVTGMADLLAQTELNDEQRHMLRTIRESGNALITVINDILDFSKIEAGKLGIESVAMSVADAVESVAATLTPNASGKGVRIHVFVDPKIAPAVQGDPVRLRQILFNLTGNAIKFSDKKDVVLRAVLHPGSDDAHCWVRFEVIDRGIGISAENQAKLFQAFSQAEASTTRRFGGTGLGLAICRRLVDLMGGTIGVDSTLGQGSTFWAELPFEPAAATPAGEALRDLAGLCVLVTASPSPRREAIAAYLGHWGAEAAIVETDDAACDALDQAPAKFTCLILDCAMDSKRQTKTAKHLRERGHKLPIVVLRDAQQRGSRVQGTDIILVEANPLVRARLVSAVAVAAGRASPEIQHDDEAFKISPSKAPPVEEAAAEGRLVLVAEDNLTNQDVIRRQLNMIGYACEIAGNGAEALQKYRPDRHAILLTDCHMPEMDGYELTERIRTAETGSGRRLPIIAITASALQAEVERCLAVGMDGCLTKPLAMPALIASLKKWIPAAPERPVPAAPVAVAQAASPARDAGSHPVNERAIKDMFGDDPAVFKEILDSFVAPSEEIVRAIVAAWKSRDADEVKGGAHKLKSSARTIGAAALADVCAALETAGKNADWDVIAALVPEAEENMQRVRSYIHAL